MAIKKERKRGGALERGRQNLMKTLNDDDGRVHDRNRQKNQGYIVVTTLFQGCTIDRVPTLHW